MVQGRTYIFELFLELGYHALLDDEMRLVQVLDDVLVTLSIDGDDDGLDRGVALDQDAWWLPRQHDKTS